MSEFTKAPWHLEGELNIVGKDGRAVCSCGFNANFGNPLEESKANARLIAASPDMYEALEFIQGFIEDYFMGDEASGEPQKTLRVVNKALKKARGAESH